MITREPRTQTELDSTTPFADDDSLGPPMFDHHRLLAERHGLETAAADHPMPSPPIEDGPEYADANSNLIDELEQILKGGFADSEPDPVLIEQPSEATFPLADSRDDPIWEDEPELSRSTTDEFDEELDPPAPFWHADDPEPQTRAEHDRPRRAEPRDYVTISMLVILIAGGAIFSGFQLSRDPAASNPTESEIVAAEPTTDDLALPVDPGLNPVNDVVEASAANAFAAQPPAAPFDPAAPAAVQDPAAGIGGLFIPAEAEPIVPAQPAADPDPIEAGLVDPLAVAVDDPAPATPEPAPIVSSAGATTPAVANAYVNLRTGPDNDAAVIFVVAEGAAVEIVECSFWCRVIAEGVEGWIYQDFLDVIEPVP